MICSGTMAPNPRPTLTPQQAAKLTEKLYGVAVTEVSGLPSYVDQNFVIVDKGGAKFVLKIMNSEESTNVTLLEVQTLAMSFLRQQGLPVHSALPTTTGQQMNMEEIDCGHGAHTYCVRMMPYLPGKTIAVSLLSKQDLYQVGKMVATVDKTLQQLILPNPEVLQRHDFVWIPSNIPLVENYLSVMDGDPLQEVISAVIGQYKSHVQPKVSSLRKGIIHGDLSDQNILVTPVDGGRLEVSGILDFSLLMSGFIVHELAVSITYMMLESPSPLDVGGALLAGWESIIPLNDHERDSLFLLVMCRLCQSLVYGRYNVKKSPENEKYILTTAKSGTRLLRELWKLGKEEVERKWFSDATTFSAI